MKFFFVNITLRALFAWRGSYDFGNKVLICGCQESRNCLKTSVGGKKKRNEDGYVTCAEIVPDFPGT